MRMGCIYLSLLAIFFAPCPLVAADEHITGDTTWEGVIAVEGKVVVDEGATLTIMPGTKVMFAKSGEDGAPSGAMAGGSGLWVHGTLLAVGKPDKRILFTSAEDEKEAGDWGEIMIELGGPSVIAHADFEYATWGLHMHFTEVEVKGSTFRNNYGGVRFRSGPVDVHDNLFEGNHIGIRSYLGGGTIRRNICTKNEMGIFISKDNGSLRIRENNIFGNRTYNFRIGDFEEKSFNISSNWWGSTDEEEIESLIYDGRRDEHVGKALYAPFLDSPADVKVFHERF